MDTTDKGGRLLTVDEAAARLGVKTPTIRAWVWQRKIGFVKVGAKCVRIRSSEIDRVIERGAVPASRIG